MDNVPTDVLVLFALEMDLPDLLHFCNSSKRINDKVCKSGIFWRKKIEKDYPTIDISNVTNYRELYEYLKGRIIVDGDYKQGHALNRSEGKILVLRDGTSSVIYDANGNFKSHSIVYSRYNFPTYPPEYFLSLGTDNIVIDNNFNTVRNDIKKMYDSKTREGYITGKYFEKYPIKFIDNPMIFEFMKMLSRDIQGVQSRFVNGVFIIDISDNYKSPTIN